MASRPESALEPSNDDESAAERTDEIEDIQADAEVEATEPLPRPRLRYLGVVASGPEVVRPPQNAYYLPRILMLGPIGKAAMLRKVPIGELIKLIPTNNYEKRERPEKRSYSRGRGL